MDYKQKVKFRLVVVLMPVISALKMLGQKDYLKFQASRNCSETLSHRTKTGTFGNMVRKVRKINSLWNQSIPQHKNLKKNVVMRKYGEGRVMAQRLKVPADLTENLDLIPGTHMWLTTVCNSSSREVNSLFWPPRTPGTQI